MTQTDDQFAEQQEHILEEEERGGREAEDEVRALQGEERLAAWAAFRGHGQDLLAVDTTGPIEWMPGGEHIIRRAERQMWVANFGEGKTQAAVQFAAQVCKAGGHVIYLDVENDTREMAERLQPVVASFGDCGTRERLAYRTDADLLTDEGKLREFVAALPTADILIIDSLTRVLATLGVDENSNEQIAHFTRSFVDVLKNEVGLATLILDNTGHEGTRARGAVSKAALVEAVYVVSGGTKISAAKHGALKLKRTRSRSGKLAAVVTAESGGGSYGPLEPQEGEPMPEPKVNEADGRKDEILRYMSKHTVVNKKLLAETFDVKPQTIGRYMADLEADGAVQEHRSDTKYKEWELGPQGAER